MTAFFKMASVTFFSLLFWGCGGSSDPSTAMPSSGGAVSAVGSSGGVVQSDVGGVSNSGGRMVTMDSASTGGRTATPGGRVAAIGGVAVSGGAPSTGGQVTVMPCDGRADGEVVARGEFGECAYDDACIETGPGLVWV